MSPFDCKPLNARRHRAFTAIEMMVVIGIVVILLSIFVPYALRLREDGRRVRCGDRLRQVFQALQAYSSANGSAFPRGPFDPAAPVTAFARATSAVDPVNDVAASLGLLLRGGYAVDGAIFLCPSVGGTPAVGAFKSRGELGYGYATPFGLSESYRLTDTLKPEFALMADAGPVNAGSLVMTAPLLRHAEINSPNHGRAGQNVLYAYGAVQWQVTPYCGMNNDNIYTVRGAVGSTQPSTEGPREPGTNDPRVLPSAIDDSFLLPSRE